jgi:hypothetical protein
MLVGARLVALLVPVALGACKVTHETKPLGLDRAIVTRTEPMRAWTLMEDGERLGVIVLYATPTSSESAEGAGAHYYSVRNGWHQELGTVDALGRTFRHVPHEREAQWIGTGTLLEGARAVLGAGPQAELIEVPIGALERAGAATD